MKLSRPLPNAKRALQMARARNLFPTTAGTAELRDMEREFLRRSVFSAGVTNTRFLQAVKTRVERLLGQEAPDIGRARRELRALLQGMGYTPEQGFGDDEPVVPGSIKDLSSNARLNLILETQIQLLSGHAQRQHGLTPSSRERAPFWEFIRVKESAAPRDWMTRWSKAGGKTEREGGEWKFIASKTADIWDKLGDAALFDDALNVNHPPFAFHSGMAWASVSAKRAERLGLARDDRPANSGDALPPEELDVSDISKPLLRELEKKLRAIEAREAEPGKLRVQSRRTRPAPETPGAQPEPDTPHASPEQGQRSRAIIRAAQMEEFNAAFELVSHA